MEKRRVVGATAVDPHKTRLCFQLRPLVVDVQRSLCSLYVIERLTEPPTRYACEKRVASLTNIGGKPSLTVARCSCLWYDCMLSSASWLKSTDEGAVQCVGR